MTDQKTEKRQEVIITIRHLSTIDPDYFDQVEEIDLAIERMLDNFGEYYIQMNTSWRWEIAGSRWWKNPEDT